MSKKILQKSTVDAFCDEMDGVAARALEMNRGSILMNAEPIPDASQKAYPTARPSDGHCQIKIQITAAANATLRRMSQQQGLTQVFIASRTMQWLADQPDDVRALVLGQVPETVAAQAARAVLKRIANCR